MTMNLRHRSCFSLLAAGSILSLVTGCPVLSPSQTPTIGPANEAPVAISGAPGATGASGAPGTAGPPGATSAPATPGPAASGASQAPNTPAPVASAGATPSSPRPSASSSATPTSPSPSSSPSATPSAAPTASATPVGTGPLPVAMTSALKLFAVLGGSTVTNSGPSVVTGDLGVSPGTGLVGFDVPGGPGTLNGTRHVGNPTAAQAKADLTTAFNDAKSRAGSPISKTGNLGGMTLAPGLYNSQSSLAISSGDLTLDAKGDANGVWIFQMGSTLTTTSGRKIILSGGAKAANIYWQVGSSATFGTTSAFKGNVLAAISITMNTGSTLEGRALTQSGAVALNSATVTRP